MGNRECGRLKGNPCGPLRPNTINVTMPSHYPDLFHAEDMPMRSFDQPEPLTDAALDRLGEFLRKCKGGKAMNIEALDGFFSALIAGPEVVLPSEYLPEVFGGEMTDTCEFDGLDEANDILGLMMRHWNTIVAALHKEDVYLPILFEDENGVCLGNNWARWVHTRSRHAQRKLGRTHDR